MHTLVTATYRAPQTVEYMLPAYIPAVLLLGWGGGWVLERLQIARTFPAIALLPAILLVAAVRQGVDRYPSFAQLHEDTSARDYAHEVLQEAPADSVILADWHWVTPLWYLQDIEKQRPDIAVRFVFPEAAPYAVTWAQRIAAELRNGRAVIATHFDETAFQELPPPEPLGEAFLFRQSPQTALPDSYVARPITLGNALQVLGYQLHDASVPIGQELALTLAWQPLAEMAGPTLFAHLVGSDGQLYAQQDLLARPQETGISLTQFRLTPRPGALPGQYQILIGAYNAAPLPDELGQSRTAVADVTITALEHPPFTGQPLWRDLVTDGPERRLVGYDWDNTLVGQPRLYLHWQTPGGYITEIRDGAGALTADLPPYRGPWGILRQNWRGLANQADDHYVPLGQGIVWTGSSPPLSTLSRRQSSLFLAQHFASSQPVLRDLVVSVRLIGYEEDGIHWAWWDLQDGVPALGAIPTLKWIRGSQVRDPQQLRIADHATIGQTVGGMVRLYDAFTNRPIPILDERISQTTPGIPLGKTILPE